MVPMTRGTALTFYVGRFELIIGCSFKSRNN